MRAEVRVSVQSTLCRSDVQALQVQRISELEKDAMGGASLHSALNDIANLKAVIASKDSYIRSLEMKVISPIPMLGIVRDQTIAPFYPQRKLVERKGKGAMHCLRTRMFF